MASHMQLTNIRVAGGGAYVQAQAETKPNDPVGYQGGNMIYRCAAGTWKFVMLVNGPTCMMNLTAEDRAAMLAFFDC